MKIKFIVEVEVGRIEEQDMTYFQKEDFQSMKPYIKEKLKNSLEGVYQYNAQVLKVNIHLAK